MVKIAILVIFFIAVSAVKPSLFKQEDGKVKNTGLIQGVGEGQCGDCKAEECFEFDEEIDDVCAGPVGPQGPTGPQGPPGPCGPCGPQGCPGPCGPCGLKGCKGPRGPKGEDGPKGPDGEVGCQGPQGCAGCQGDQGDEGPRGVSVKCVSVPTPDCNNECGAN
ncbi:unnamed protein product [Blepharisma stoltei]|uniref:Uncharacterized protein n=1 Tax=Blepharisma stoltei TaxID=1481888 RepID=A0AAU9IC27_9CILI|nr:unnamed protein product [Blepharisma stoltei]